MKRLTTLFLLVALLPLAGRAADLEARAEAAWSKRDDATQARAAVDLYTQLSDRDPGDVDSRIRLARATYWYLEELKVELDKDEKIRLHEKAILGCNEIIKKDESNVAAWHWLIWDMGALTLIKGVFSGWNLREAIVGTIMVAKGDASYNHGGVYRYWGRVIYETPGLMGKFLHFTDEDSIWLYQQAITVEPKYVRNHLFLGETYEKLGREADAKREYQFCVDLPDDAIPELAPETRHYKNLAKKKLARM